MVRDCRGNSDYISNFIPRLGTLSDEFLSIIEGTKESLERLQMDYVDILFAHRCDINGMDARVSPNLI
jgi:hypothetical protein